MCLNLSCYQFKTGAICEPHSNHKAKTHSKCTEENAEGIQTEQARKPANCRRRETGKKKETGATRKTDVFTIPATREA